MDGGVANELIKHRELRFCRLHPDPQQSHSASLLLSDVDGIVRVEPADPLVLQVSYDLSLLSLRMLEDVLTEVGFHLDNSLFLKLRRALHYYTEETQRANLGLCVDCGVDVKVFINRYQKLRHGCRDLRPEHWRSYL